MSDPSISDRLLAIEEKLNHLPFGELARILKVTSDIATASHQQTMQAVSLLVRELASIKHSVGLTSKRIPVPQGRKIRCVFMVHHITFWGTFASVLRAMQETEDFDPIVVTVRYDDAFCKNQGFSWEEEAHQGLENLNVPHIRFSMDDSFQGLDILKALSPDIIFRQGPWDDAFPPGYRTAELSFARLCYINYSFAMPKKFAPHVEPVAAGFAAPHHADQLFHRMCWRIYCETDIHQKMYGRSATRGESNLVTTGYTKFDSLLHAAETNPPFWPIAAADGKRRLRIIWAPHCSVTTDYLGFGMFQDVYKDMLAWARARPDMEFVLRPHPMTFGLLISKNVMTQADLDAFFDAWKSLPNTGRYDGGEYGPFFQASDVMVTDGVGFFAEYQLFLKPLIFMDSQRHTGFNEAGEIVMESANRVTTVAQAQLLCERFQKGEPDPMATIQKRNLSRIMPYPKQSARKILENIREGLAYERGERAHSA